MRVLSLFDGLGGARVALDNLGVDCVYHACEVDKYAIQTHVKNYPKTRQWGDVCKFTGIADIDLLVGGSPCQSFSSAKRQKESGLDKGESQLLWEYIRLLKKVKPKYFLLENVASMKASDRDAISKLIGVQPIMINSSLVTGQLRRRWYWTNIPGVDQPVDRLSVLQDILEDGCADRHKSYCLTATYGRANIQDYFCYGQRQMIFKKPFSYTASIEHPGFIMMEIGGKKFLLSTTRGSKEGHDKIKPFMRRLTPIECERLQGLPDNYTQGVSTSQRYKMIGNGFTVPVIEHILSHIPELGIHNGID